MTQPVVSAQWLNENINNSQLILLDVSNNNKGVRIPGARPFNLPSQFSDKSSKFPNTLQSEADFQAGVRALGINNESLIVTYDEKGIFTSSRAWWMLKSMGHKNVAVLDGGMPEWNSLGFATEAVAPVTYSEGNFEAVLAEGTFRNYDFVLANSQDPKFLVVDARSADRFSGEAAEPRKGLASGHIPNSVNLPFSEVLSNGKLKSKKELEVVFSDINSDHRSIVFSCGSGLTACIILLASELVSDKQKSVYDGSWTEWSQLQA